MSSNNFVDNYLGLYLDLETDRDGNPQYYVNPYSTDAMKELVFTCETCWECSQVYTYYCDYTQALEEVKTQFPKFLKRCKDCNSKFIRWKWRKKFQERIPLRPSDRQWLATFTWGQPLVNATAEERDIILDAMKIAMQKLTKTKLWKETFSGYVWVYEEAIHDESRVKVLITKQEDLFGNVVDYHEEKETILKVTHHPHIHAVLEKKDNTRFSKEEFEQLKNHVRKYFSQYVWFKKIQGKDSTAKAINYTLKYISKDMGSLNGTSARRVFIGGTWREKPTE